MDKILAKKLLPLIKPEFQAAWEALMEYHKGSLARELLEAESESALHQVQGKARLVEDLKQLKERIKAELDRQDIVPEAW